MIKSVFVLLTAILFPLTVFSGATNLPAPSTFAVFTDTNGVIVAPTNWRSANAIPLTSSGVTNTFTSTVVQVANPTGILDAVNLQTLSNQVAALATTGTVALLQAQVTAISNALSNSSTGDVAALVVTINTVSNTLNAALTNHVAQTNNPHAVTALQAGAASTATVAALQAIVTAMPTGTWSGAATTGNLAITRGTALSNQVIALSNQFVALSGKALTNVIGLIGSTNTAYASNLTAYIQFGTNFTYPSWYRLPPTNYLSTAALWYSFDTEAPAYIHDVTGNGNDGVEVFAAGGRNMWSNYAYRISSIEENYIRQTNSVSLLNGQTEFTVGLWFSCDTACPTNFQNVIFSCIQSNSGNWYGMDMYAITSTSLLFRVFGSSGGNNYSAGVGWNHGTNISKSTWHRLVCTYKKNGNSSFATAHSKIFFDGYLKVSKTNDLNCFSDVRGNWTFGGFHAAQDTTAAMWDGLLDDLVLDPYAWDAATVSNDFSSGRSLAP